VKPETEAEKSCFQVLKDLDPIAAQVNGSMTSKKYMHNKIWSLIAHRGTPVWYITISPADVRHPISIYWADTKEKFEPVVLKYNERLNMICKNPAASACFFHFLLRFLLDRC